METVVYDLCVVGAGFFGCAAARHASANPSLKICLIGLDEPKEHEMADREIFSSHYDAGRIIKTLFESPAYHHLSKKTIKHLKHLERVSGLKLHDPVGFLRIGMKGSKEMKDLEDISAAVGACLIEMSEKDYNDKMYPFFQMKDDEYGLLDFDNAGVIYAREVLEAEKNVAHEQGCRIIADQVMQIYELLGKCHNIETKNSGVIKARKVLITTGAFTNINKFRILPQLEMYVYKEMATLIRIPDSEANRLSRMPGIVHIRNKQDIGSYIVPPVQYPDGRYYLKIGSMDYASGKELQTSKEIKEWFLSEEKPGETSKMSQLLFKLLPGVKSDGLFRKICVTAETPTGFPYIDLITPTITIAVAANAWGASTGDEIGRLAATLSLTGIWDTHIPHGLFRVIAQEEKN